MTVLYEKPALNLRSELASLKNQGGYSEQQFWFDSLVTNGDFATNITGWTDPADGRSTSSFVSGTMRITNAGSGIGYGYADQQITGLVIGQTYTVSWDVSAPATLYSTRVTLGTTNGGTPVFASVAAAVTGTQTFTFIARATSYYLALQIFTATLSISMDFDNVSVYETDGTDAIYTMPKGWVPKDVFEDGLLQREGAANDYTVVYDGFDYYVKPVVAPSATTQTCVIGVRA